MFFKKKKKVDLHSTRYAVSIVTEYPLEDEDYDPITDEIGYHCEAVDALANFNRAYSDPAELKLLEEKCNITSWPDMYFVVTTTTNQDIENEIKLLEKKHKWKKFFDVISPIEYTDAMDKAYYNFNNIKFASADIEEIIAYINKQSEATQKNSN